MPISSSLECQIVNVWRLGTSIIMHDLCVGARAKNLIISSNLLWHHLHKRALFCFSVAIRSYSVESTRYDLILAWSHYRLHLIYAFKSLMATRSISFRMIARALVRMSFVFHCLHFQTLEFVSRDSKWQRSTEGSTAHSEAWEVGVRGVCKILIRVQLEHRLYKRSPCRSGPLTKARSVKPTRKCTHTRLASRQALAHGDNEVASCEPVMGRDE